MMTQTARRRRWVLRGAVMCGAAFALLSASVLMAKPGIVKTRDGRSIEGDIDDRGDTVVVTVRGIPTNIPRDSVDTVTYTGAIDEQYKEKLAALPKNAAAADHLDLAKWLLSNKAYDLAMKEVTAAQRIDPNSTDAATLQQTIEGQMRLDRARKGTPTTVTPRTPAGTTPTGTTPAGGSGLTASMHKYISNDDVNTIRQMEWPADDNSVKVTFNNDVKRRFVSRMQDSAAAFNSQNPVAQAKRILVDGTPEERKDVKLLSDPAPLAEYKRTIQPVILTNCATAACHGGPAGGRFFLYSTPENDNATYTNFYLLSQASAKPNEGPLMIDRQTPEQSLLVLWGLPVEVSKTSHPVVPGTAWRSIYKSADDPQYKVMTNWMAKLVPVNAFGNLPVPKYGIVSPLPSTEPPAPVTPPPATRGTGARPPATRPAPARTR